MSTPCGCAGPTFASQVVPLTFCDVCGRSWDSPDEPTVADLADVPIWRYHPSPDVCEHPVTVTKRLDIVQPIPGDPEHVRVIGQTTGAVTACLDCHHLAPAQEDQ